MRAIESPGPRVMPAHNEATGIVYTRGQSPGDEWAMVRAHHNDSRRYFRGLYEWRRTAVDNCSLCDQPIGTASDLSGRVCGACALGDLEEMTREVSE